MSVFLLAKYWSDSQAFALVVKANRITVRRKLTVNIEEELGK